MQEIGLKLKEKREENGVSVEEAAEDMKMRPSQIISLEEGRKQDFKDVTFLKLFIRDYSKYLGLDGDKMVDEFNEFLFDFTTKIPVEEIEKAKENNVYKKDVASPYTNSRKENNSIKFIIGAIIFIVLFITIYVVVSNVRGNDFKDDDVTFVIRR